MRRAQQYYGIKYYQTKVDDSVLQPTVSTDHHPLELLQFVVDKSIKMGIFKAGDPPNQILINKYTRGDKLGLHVENIQAFGPIIAGVSLGSTDYLRLVDVNDNQNAHLLELEDCSCYVLED